MLSQSQWLLKGKRSSESPFAVVPRWYPSRSLLCFGDVDCYCDYFILILFNKVMFSLRLGCPGSLMSLYGPTFHVTRVDLCIMFQCNLYISCIMSCGNKIVSNCFKLFQIVVCTGICRGVVIKLRST